MKLKIINRYVDKNTKKIVEADDVVEHEESRAKELIESGVAEVMATTKDKGNTV